MAPFWTEISGVFRTAAGYFQQGGWVMPALAAASLWLWALIVLKLWELSGARKAWRRLDEGGEGGRLSELVRRFRSVAIRDRFRREAWLDSLLIREKRFLERHVAAILLLSAIAPLIGLLGTVSGMIATFQVIEYHGAGNANGLAGGISEALITTQSGLVVAVPGLIMGNLIQRRVDRLKRRLDAFGLNLLEESPVDPERGEDGHA